MTQFAMFESRFGRPDEAPVAVAESFSWLAAILPPVFFVRHGLWLELIAFILAVVALDFAGLYIGSGAVFWLYVLLAAWLGFAAASIRRAALKRGGWRYRGELTAPAADTARLVWLKLGAPR
jgi:hypothetical protein